VNLPFFNLVALGAFAHPADRRALVFLLFEIHVTVAVVELFVGLLADSFKLRRVGAAHCEGASSSDADREPCASFSLAGCCGCCTPLFLGVVGCAFVAIDRLRTWEKATPGQNGVQQRSRHAKEQEGPGTPPDAHVDDD